MKPLKILIIDDEPDLNEILKDLLESEGHNCTAHTLASSALQDFGRQGDFDIVVTDINMPDMTGDQLIPKLRDLNANIPILLCSGQMERVAPALPKVAIVHKPYKPDYLLDLIRQLTGQ